MSAPHAPAAAQALLQGVAPLPQLGVILAEGEDAASFLHGQLSQDFQHLREDEAHLAAYCSAKGRMLASFIGLRAGPSRILLICSRDLLPATLRRLSMFVLRAKVRLSDASADWHLRGLAGASAASGGATPWSLRRAGEAAWITLYPADGVARALWVAPAGTPEPEGPPLPQALWAWGEVRAGVPTLGAALVEAFVPQMLNYESVGGVNFRKGCYPGQEVVARSQFRGTLKRRAGLFHAEVEPAVAAEVFSAADAAQPAGQVVQAAPNPAGGWDAIVSLQLAAMAAGGLRLGSAEGAALQPLPLPYPLLADI